MEGNNNSGQVGTCRRDAGATELVQERRVGEVRTERVR